MTIKILVFVPSQWWGGSFVRFKNVLRRFKKYDVKFISVKIEYQIEQNIMFTILKLFLSILRALQNSISLIKRNDIQLIVSPVEHQISVLTAYIASKFTKRPLCVILNATPLYGFSPNIHNCNQIGTSFKDIYREVLYYTSSTIRKIFNAIAWYLIMKCLRSAYLVPVSPTVLTEITRLGLKDNVLHICLGNGIDYEKIAAIPAPRGKSIDGIFVGNVSRFKGVFDIIKIWKNVVEYIPTAKLGIVCYGDQKAIECLIDKIKKEGLEKNIIILSDTWLSQTVVWSFMKQARLLVHPSYKESWGLVVAEALACGLPVVTYDIPAVKLVYGSCSSVICVKVGDVVEFSKKVVQLLTDHKLRNLLSKKGKIWSRRFTWDEVVKKEKLAYEIIIRSYYGRK